MKGFFFLLFGVAIFIAIIGYLTGPVTNRDGNSPLENLIQNMAPKKEVAIGDTKIAVEIAKTAEERRIGLSEKSSLPENQGMLFVFEDSGKPTFWMKGMSIAIDIIWIDEGGKIVGIEKDVQPEPGVSDNDLARYNPSEPIKYVLEVSAGFTDKKGIERGMQVTLPESF